jgi:hypothetical protein
VVVPDESEDHARPEKHDTSNRAPILLVLEWSFSGFLKHRQVSLLTLNIRTCYIRTLARHNICVRQSVGKRGYAGEDRASFPSNLDTS